MARDEVGDVGALDQAAEPPGNPLAATIAAKLGCDGDDTSVDDDGSHPRQPSLRAGVAQQIAAQLLPDPPVARAAAIDPNEHLEVDGGDIAPAVLRASTT
jgi:hypothetical protein